LWKVEYASTARLQLVRDCPVNLNGVYTKVDLNIITLRSHDILIVTYWMDKNHDVLYCHNKEFTRLDEEVKKKIVKGIPRPISIKEISVLQMK
jgi:hypothetical protein